MVVFLPAVCLALLLNAPSALAGPPEPTPVPPPEQGDYLQDSGISEDRLAIPTLPANPTDVDRGRVVYYYNCMTCHGDRGQGLTDEWRAAWVDDHQNCWGRGCHGVNREDGIFPIPRKIPAVYGESYTLRAFPSQGDLLAYLKRTHPPQRPGSLSEADYQQVTAFLMAENGWPLVEKSQPVGDREGWLALAGILGGFGLLVFLTLIQKRRISK